MMSLWLGLLAWLLPMLAFTQLALLKRWFGRSWVSVTTFISMTACVLAIWFELYAQYKRLMSQDISAMQDIFPTSVFAALFLLVTTVILNAILLYRSSSLPC